MRGFLAHQSFCRPATYLHVITRDNKITLLESLAYGHFKLWRYSYTIEIQLRHYGGILSE